MAGTSHTRNISLVFVALIRVLSVVMLLRYRVVSFLGLVLVFLYKKTQAIA